MGFRDSDVLRHAFETVVRRCMAEGLIGGEGFAVDASLIKPTRAAAPHARSHRKLRAGVCAGSILAIHLRMLRQSSIGHPQRLSRLRSATCARNPCIPSATIALGAEPSAGASFG
jgi:hypothetical protein